MTIKSAHALRVLILTPYIHNHLTRHKPEALDAAIAALREELPEDEFTRVEELLTHLAAMGLPPLPKPPKVKAPKPPKPPKVKPPKIKLPKPPKPEAPTMMTIVEVRELPPPGMTAELGPELPKALRPKHRVFEPRERKRKPKRQTDAWIVELLREAKGDKSVKRLARDIGIQQPELSNILNRKRPPSQKIYRFLGIPMPQRTNTFSGDDEP